MSNLLDMIDVANAVLGRGLNLNETRRRQLRLCLQVLIRLLQVPDVERSRLDGRLEFWCLAAALLYPHLFAPCALDVEVNLNFFNERARSSFVYKVKEVLACRVEWHLDTAFGTATPSDIKFFGASEWDEPSDKILIQSRF